MLNKEKSLKKLNEMPVEEVQKRIRQALEDSGIEYTTNGTGISLAEFFEPFHNEIVEHLNELKHINN